MSVFPPERKVASPSTIAHQQRVEASMNSSDATDFDDASRGLIAPGPRQVEGRYGQALWDRDAYAFLDDPVFEHSPPNTVNPSLWRQGRLNNIAGLFEVTPSIFQVRGMDISNVTFIAGDSGWVVIDPLTSQETASAALSLVNEHLGQSASPRRHLHPQPHRPFRWRLRDHQRGRCHERARRCDRAGRFPRRGHQ